MAMNDVKNTIQDDERYRILDTDLALADGGKKLRTISSNYGASGFKLSNSAILQPRTRIQ